MVDPPPGARLSAHGPALDGAWLRLRGRRGDGRWRA